MSPRVMLTQHLFDGKWEFEIHLSPLCVHAPGTTFETRDDAHKSAEAVVKALAASCKSLSLMRPEPEFDGAAD